MDSSISKSIVLFEGHYIPILYLSEYRASHCKISNDDLLEKFILSFPKVAKIYQKVKKNISDNSDFNKTIDNLNEYYIDCTKEIDSDEIISVRILAMAALYDLKIISTGQNKESIKNIIRFSSSIDDVIILESVNKICSDFSRLITNVIKKYAFVWSINKYGIKIQTGEKDYRQVYNTLFSDYTRLDTWNGFLYKYQISEKLCISIIDFYEELLGFRYDIAHHIYSNLKYNFDDKTIDTYATRIFYLWKNLGLLELIETFSKGNRNLLIYSIKLFFSSFCDKEGKLVEVVNDDLFIDNIVEQNRDIKSVDKDTGMTVEKDNYIFTFVNIRKLAKEIFSTTILIRDMEDKMTQCYDKNRMSELDENRINFRDWQLKIEKQRSKENYIDIKIQDFDRKYYLLLSLVYETENKLYDICKEIYEKYYFKKYIENKSIIDINLQINLLYDQLCDFYREINQLQMALCYTYSVLDKKNEIDKVNSDPSSVFISSIEEMVITDEDLDRVLGDNYLLISDESWLSR